MNYETTLGDLALADDRLVVMTAENRAPIRNLPPLLGRRFIDTGIAEQTMVGMASGLALRGRVPVIHALAAFLTMRAFEFLRTDVGIGRLPVEVVGTVAGVLSEANGPTHQALEDVALMRGIPGFGVFCPGDLDDLLLGLPSVLADPNPWYIRYVDRPAAIGHQPFAIGKAEVLVEGSDVGFLVYGTLLREVLEAAGRLDESEISSEVVNLRTVKPIDEEMIVRVARATRVLVTVEDHFLAGGLYSIVCDILVRHGIRATVHPVSLGERWFKPGLLPDLLAAEGLKGSQIAARVRAALERAA